MTSHVTLHSCLSVFFSSYRSILRSDRHILHALSTASSTVTFPLEMLQSMTPPIAMSPLSGRHQYANAMERFSSCYHVNPINHASIRSAFLLASSTLLSPNVTHGYLEKRWRVTRLWISDGTWSSEARYNGCFCPRNQVKRLLVHIIPVRHEPTKHYISTVVSLCCGSAAVWIFRIWSVVIISADPDSWILAISLSLNLSKNLTDLAGRWSTTRPT